MSIVTSAIDEMQNDPTTKPVPDPVIEFGGEA